GVRNGTPRGPIGWHETCREDVGVRAAVSLLTLGFFAPVAAGCISNEYVIPPQELNRLVQTPPELRGQHVHVIQELGSRRADPIPTENTNYEQAGAAWSQISPDQPIVGRESRDADVELDVRTGGNVDVGGGGDPGGARPRGWRGTPRSGGAASSSSVTWHGSPPSGGGVTWHGSPPSGSGGGWHGVPPPSSGGGSSGGGSWLSGGSGGGGGGNGGDAMI